MQISDLLSSEVIRVGDQAGTKQEVLASLFDLVAERQCVLDAGEMRRAVLEREQVMSTGVGYGLALPHAKTDAVSATLAALLITENPVDFESIDREPVRIAFLLVGMPSGRSTHIRILSRISRLMNRMNFREHLAGARTADEALDTIRRAEAELLEH